MKQLVKVPIIALVLLLAFSVMPNYAVYAEDAEAEQSEQEKKAQEAAKKLEEQRREAAKKRSEELKKQQEKENEEESEASKQVAERFKKACENRRESYKSRLENIAERSQKHVEVLDKIVDRVKEFKQNKNLNVENYDALLADIEAKKLVVHNLQEAAKEQAEVEFDCERNAAKEAVNLFNDVLHQQIEALKDYKTAVKNLIVAVKTAAEVAEPTTESEGSDSNED